MKKRSVIIISFIVLVILIGLFFALHEHRLHFRSPVVFLPDAEHVVTSSTAHPVQQSTAVLQTPQAYSDKVMEFNNNCVASPITIVANRGDAIVFSNSSRYQRSITVGDQSYDVGPFAHIVLSFGAIDTYQINCDSFTKVGLIGIQ